MIYKIFNYNELSGLAVSLTVTISLVYWILLLVALLIIDILGFNKIGNLELYQTINVYFGLIIVFYPITFTIIYTPIALLLAIPVVLYKHVFKLG